MTKTIKVDQETHEHIKEYLEKNNLSTFGEAVEKAIRDAEGILDESGWIVSTRDTLGGQPRIKGTRIGILNIHQWYFEEDLSTEEIASNYYVDEEGVEAAVEYIKNHEDEIERIRKEYEIAEKASQELAKQKLQELNTC